MSADTTVPVDESPISEFIAKMRECFLERLTATGDRDKRDLERKMEGIMREYLGRSAWDAAAAADEDLRDVPRGTSRDRVCHKRRVRAGRVGARRYPDGFDHKLAQAGDRSDDE